MLAGELSGIKGEPQVVTKEDKFSFLDLLKGNFPGKLVGDIFSGIQLKYMFTL